MARQFYLTQSIAAPSFPHHPERLAMSYCWYFTQEDIKDKTPSREEGITPTVEARYRRDGARFIINASNTLGLRYDTMATGVVFFHRFFMVQSFKQFDRWVVGAACLLLSGKVEETPKKCKDILKVTRAILNDQQMAGFGNNPKEELLTHERVLLQTVKFDLQLEHPYSYLLKFAKELKGEKSKIEKLVQMAWTFVNDSLCTTLCLQWEPQAIAVAFLYLAGKLTKFDLQGLSQSKSRSWWRQFVDTLDFHDLESICHQVLDIYGERDSDEKKSESAANELDPTHHQKTPPSKMATPPPATTPTQGQLLSIHPQQQHRYHSNHHSPSPVPPPPPPPTCTAGAVVVPIGQGAIPPQQGSLQQQQSQVTYIAHQSYNLGDPLQALQAIRPVTNTAGSAATLPYSTLNVSVGNNTTALPRGGAPVVQQSFSQLPGGQKPQQQQQQVVIVGGYQQQVATPLGVGGQGVAKNLSATAGVNASSLPGAIRVGSAGVANYQQQMSVLTGVGGVVQRTGTGTRIGSGIQVIGNMRTGQQQPGLTPAQQQALGGSYLTPPPSKRTAYDLSSYRPSGGALPQATSLLSAQSLTGLNQQSSHQQQQQQQQLTAKPPSLLPPTTNSLTINRLPSLMGQQQQQSSVLYRTNSQTQQHGATTLLGASAAVASQLPGGAVGQQLSSLSSLTPVGGRGGLPGQQQAVHLGGVGAGAATGTPVVRPVSGLPQPQPSPTARPQSGYGGLQQNYGATSGSSGRGATWR